MSVTKRKIIKILEERCTGCGACVLPCAEGAIEIVNGKARLIREELCDGAGFCLGICPEGALVIEERVAEAFSHDAVEKHVRESISNDLALACFRCATSEHDSVLMPCRKDGQSVWVCVKCLPALIHGKG
ncbi:MAG: 4Fe-4S binding protein [Candidatus Abyssubacteria bacterium]